MNNDNTQNQPRDEQAPYELSKPNWDEWKSAKQAKLWEAASLACDLDPRNFKINGQPVFRFIGGLPEPIEELLSMAKGSIGAGGVLKPVFLSGEGLAESEVTLANFSKWAESIGMGLPQAFPGKSVSKQTSQEETALGERERATLLTLIAALAQEAGIDISKPSKAAGLIEGLTMRLNARVAARTIEDHLKRIPAALEKRSL